MRKGNSAARPARTLPRPISGIVQSDPLIPMDRTLIPSPPPRPKNPVFDDEEKSKLLAKLLKSKNPDDLQEANKLIKSMVKEDEARIQKVTKRLHTLEEVNNNVKLLSEMLLHYSKEDSSEADKELMKELSDRCESKRRTLFKLASETEDDDSSLGDILQASDNLSRVINSYKTVVEGQVISGEAVTSAVPDSEGNHRSSNQGASLIDLAELDAPSSLSPVLAPVPHPSGIPILPPPPQALGPGRSHSSSQAEAPPGPSSTSHTLSLLDEELLCLGASWVLEREASGGAGPVSPTQPPVLLPETQLETASGPCSRTSGLVKPVSSGFFAGAATSSLLPTGTSARLLLPFSTGPGSPLFQPPAFQSQGSPMQGSELSLTSVHVPLESIKPSSALPVTAYDKNGFRILFHFAKECPPGRPDVLVVVVSMLNTAPLPIKSIVLQAAVPKSMKVKLQPPSGTELSPFSPVQPPAAITQVMLLANPLKEKARLRYRLTFALGEQLSTEVGEVDQFPPVEQWGSL
ncbi:ADP-ribosylation factor-binding protein GGA3 [Pontoporia blainvillei]|uniref:ADP-ribosylation factor-binding protein GGA3 n=1 Tax=Pontoporia blainvillei TaxID=48723 RepID=A0ABX0S8K4_PONBL|nr:ADP-ribosylation factor-binding protein GGA3 [Pontoporia blainvillei]